MDATSEARLSLLEQAWTLHRSGDMPGVVQLLSRVPTVDLIADPELGILLGFGWYHCGQGQRTLELVHALYEPLRREGNSSLHRRLQNLHAIVLLSRGEVDAAARMWTDLQEKSHDAGDQLSSGWAHNNLAIVADIQCRWEDSLANAQRAGAAYQRLGDLRALGAAYHTMGMTYRQLGLLNDAAGNFERAAEYLRNAGNENEIARTEMERGLTLCLLGDQGLARASVNRALQRYTRLGHDAGKSDCWRVLAIFALREGQSDEARRLLEAGLKLVREAVDKLTEAEILEELSVLEKMAGNLEESAQRAKEAAVLYRGMGADCRADKMERRLSEVTPAADTTSRSD